MYDLIMKKRNGGVHTEEELCFIVEGFTKGEIPDYQMSAWLMCVYYQGMTKEETVILTTAMAKSGDIMDLSGIEGVKVDKHSTGGVGDKTTFIVAPILASLGVPIAKMSGRGLGHTGGTIDKLESIPGFHVEISQEEFISNVNNMKLALVGQTGNLAPADKKIYALRDVTASVDSIPLIASSIMSKKIAAGADVIVLDVKCGSGAFMHNQEDAVKLAQTMVDIGYGAKRKCYGVITDMNEPLGCKVGNALEVMEAIEALNIEDMEALYQNEEKKGLQRLMTVSLTLAAYMYIGAGKETDFDAAKAKCIHAIESKNALKKLAEFVQAQGGDANYIYHPQRFEIGQYEVKIPAPKTGYLQACNTSEVGMVSLMLGGGRATKESEIDLGVGLDICKHLGDYVEEGETMAIMYASDESVVEAASRRFQEAYTIGSEKVEPEPIIKQVII